MRRQSESIEWVERGGGDRAKSERDDGSSEHSVGGGVGGWDDG